MNWSERFELAIQYPSIAVREAGPYRAIPRPGPSWQPEGSPTRRPHEYVRGGTAKSPTLFRPATHAVLHPWLEREVTAILAACPPPLVGRRRADREAFSATWGLDGIRPPLRSC